MSIRLGRIFCASKRRFEKKLWPEWQAEKPAVPALSLPYCRKAFFGGFLRHSPFYPEIIAEFPGLPIQAERIVFKIQRIVDASAKVWTRLKLLFQRIDFFLSIVDFHIFPVKFFSLR